MRSRVDVLLHLLGLHSAALLRSLGLRATRASASASPLNHALLRLLGPRCVVPFNVQLLSGLSLLGRVAARMLAARAWREHAARELARSRRDLR